MTGVLFSQFLAPFAAAAPSIPLPAPDPLGYPLQPILLQVLAYFTLTLHFLAMNLTVGALLLLLWVRLTKPAGHPELGRFLAGVLPLGMSYLITLGVPPLLFVQVLYGQMFYTSSILIGFHWILVVPFALFAYAVFYYRKFTARPDRRRVLVLLGLAAAALLTIGFFFVNNTTLSVSPDKWLQLYQSRPGGQNLNLSDPTVVPRWLLFLAPGFSIVGVALLLRGTVLLRWGQAASAKGSQALGWRAFLLGMALEAALAGWLLVTLPDNIRAFVLAGSLPTLLLGLGVGLAVLAGVVFWRARNRTSLLFPVLTGVLMFAALTPLVVLRDLVRQAYLQPYFELSQVPVNPQWGMFGLFAAFLVVGLVFLVAMHLLVVPNLLRGRKAQLDAQVASAGTETEPV